MEDVPEMQADSTTHSFSCELEATNTSLSLTQVQRRNNAVHQSTTRSKNFQVRCFPISQPADDNSSQLIMSQPRHQHFSFHFPFHPKQVNLEKTTSTISQNTGCSESTNNEFDLSKREEISGWCRLSPLAYSTTKFSSAPTFKPRTPRCTAA